MHAMQALAMQDAYEAEDEVDDAADDAAEAQQKRSRAAALATGATLPDTSAYFHERLYWGACDSPYFQTAPSKRRMVHASAWKKAHLAGSCAP